MCLGVPGQVVRIEESAAGMPMGSVSFGGATRDVCLVYVPDAKVGDWVLVHVGFALARVDEAQAAEIRQVLARIGAFEDEESPARADAP